MAHIQQILDELGGYDAVEAALSRDRIRAGGLHQYVREAWHLIEPARPFVDNWCAGAISEHLAAVSAGQIRKLIINIPPGMGKSSYVSVLWPSWEWAMRPWLRWMFASYREQLSLRDAIRRRDVVISSDWYRARWGERYRITKDSERYYTNTAQGSMLSTSTGGTVTGFRAHRLVLDDPHDPEGAISDVQRASTTEWLTLTWPTRLDDTPQSAEVLVMQRLHESDASGLYLKQGGWTHLKIPMEYKGKTYCPADPRTHTGELLDERIYSRAYVDDRKRRLGPYGEASQYDQEPSPLGGGIVKRAWIKYWHTSDRQPGLISCYGGLYHYRTDGSFRFCAVDPAITDKDLADRKSMDPDYTVISAWSALATPQGTMLCLMDLIRERLEGPDILDRLEAMHRHHRFHVIGLETVAFQKALFQFARRRGLPVREISTRADDDVLYRIDKDKVSRLLAATPLMASGRFHVPEYAPWLAEYIDELTRFPNAAHDDQCDVTAYACAIAEKYVPGLSLEEQREDAIEPARIEREYSCDEAPRDPLEGYYLTPPSESA